MWPWATPPLPRRCCYGNAPSIPRDKVCSRQGMPPSKVTQQDERLTPLSKAARAELMQRRGFGGAPSSTGASFSRASLHPLSFGPTPPIASTAHPSMNRALFNGTWWTSYGPTIHEPSHRAAHLEPFGPQRQRINAISRGLMDADHGANQAERQHAEEARKAARREANYTAGLTFEQVLQRRKAERRRGGWKPIQVQALNLEMDDD